MCKRIISKIADRCNEEKECVAQLPEDAQQTAKGKNAICSRRYPSEQEETRMGLKKLHETRKVHCSRVKESSIRQ